MDQIKDSYRQFLNSSAGRYLEPNSLVSPLLKAKLLSIEEAEIVKNEPTRAKRQYVSAVIYIESRSENLYVKAFVSATVFKNFAQ